MINTRTNKITNYSLNQWWTRLKTKYYNIEPYCAKYGFNRMTSYGDEHQI